MEINMGHPRQRLLGAAPTAVVLVVAATMLAMAATSGAVAAKLITGKQIARDTVTAKNLAPGSVGKSELQKGLLKAGPTGQPGPAGPTGPTGPAGTSDPDEIFTWKTSYTSDGTIRYNMTAGRLPAAVSTQTLPRFSRVEVRSVDISDDFRGCRVANVAAVPTGRDYNDDLYSNAPMFTASQMQGHDPVNVVTDSQAIYTQGTDWHLTLYAECLGDTFERIVIPSFNATVVFTSTELPATPANSFQ